MAVKCCDRSRTSSFVDHVKEGWKFFGLVHVAALAHELASSLQRGKQQASHQSII
jgi:hypothetical protein